MLFFDFLLTGVMQETWTVTTTKDHTKPWLMTGWCGTRGTVGGTPSSPWSWWCEPPTSSIHLQSSPRYRDNSTPAKWRAVSFVLRANRLKSFLNINLIHITEHEPVHTVTKMCIYFQIWNKTMWLQSSVILYLFCVQNKAEHGRTLGNLGTTEVFQDKQTQSEAAEADSVTSGDFLCGNDHWWWFYMWPKAKACELIGHCFSFASILSGHKVTLEDVGGDVSLCYSET